MEPVRERHVADGPSRAEASWDWLIDDGTGVGLGADLRHEMNGRKSGSNLIRNVAEKRRI